MTNQRVKKIAVVAMMFGVSAAFAQDPAVSAEKADDMDHGSMQGG